MTSMRPAEVRADAVAVRLVGWKMKSMDNTVDVYWVSVSVHTLIPANKYDQARQKNTMFSIPSLPLHPIGYSCLQDDLTYVCVYLQCCILSIQHAKLQVRLMLIAGFPKFWSTVTPYLGPKIFTPPLTVLCSCHVNLGMALDGLYQNYNIFQIYLIRFIK